MPWSIRDVDNLKFGEDVIIDTGGPQMPSRWGGVAVAINAARVMSATALQQEQHQKATANAKLIVEAVNSHAALLREREALREALTCDGNSVNLYTLLDWCADRFWLVANGETDKLGDREGQEAVIAMLRSKGKLARAALGDKQ